jgi:hypothetical protein
MDLHDILWLFFRCEGKVKACYTFNRHLLSFRYPSITLLSPFRYPFVMRVKCMLRNAQENTKSRYRVTQLSVYLYIFIYLT